MKGEGLRCEQPNPRRNGERGENGKNNGRK